MLNKESEKLIERLRGEIDKVDDALLGLLDKRMDVVKKIGEIKAKSQASIYRPEREKAIIQRLSSLKSQHLQTQAIEAIFLEIFAIARNLEKPEKIAFLGPIGSYTHQAAEERFGAMSEYLPMYNIPAVFSALKQGRAKYGVIPIENNTNGIVGASIDCLVESDLKIISEVILPIHHSFASLSEKIEKIRKIYSKDIAFGQCSIFLRSHGLENIEWIPVDSTAKAAQLCKKEENSAAICSKIAAKLYDIPIMFENIEDCAKNKTRFVIISNFSNAPGRNDKTSVFAKLKDFDKPGVLFRLLQDFATCGINLTKIDSRPIRDKENFSFGFYIDFLGHREDENVVRLFEKYGDELKWLGSYACDHAE